MKAICSVDGCERPIIARSLCSKHYQRFMSHGDTNIPVKIKEPMYSNGYRIFCSNGTNIYEHRVIAEKVLGKPLPKGAVVHHVNGDRSDNRPENLVICPDKNYHRLLHKRTDAINAGYPPDYRKCRYCHQYDNPDSMDKSGVRIYHRKCSNDETKKRYQLKKLSKSLTVIT